MPFPFARRVATLLALPILLAVAACSDDHDDGHGDMHMLEVIDRGQTNQPVVATWTLSGGWEGSLPSVSLSSTNQRISIGFRAFAPDGDEVTLSESGPLSIRYGLASGATTGIIDTGLADNVLFHGDHVHIYGTSTGSTQIQFLLWDVDHADRATTPISITVVE